MAAAAAQQLIRRNIRLFVGGNHSSPPFTPLMSAAKPPSMGARSFSSGSRHRICSHVRMNNLSAAVRTSLRIRSHHSSGSPSPVPGDSGILSWPGAATYGMCTYWTIHRNTFGSRQMIVDYMAEREVKRILERLNRDKLIAEDKHLQTIKREDFVSADAYLDSVMSKCKYDYQENLEREIDALKEKLFGSELEYFDASVCEREIAALNSLVGTWKFGSI